MKQTVGEVEALKKSMHLLTSSSEENIDRLRTIVETSDQKMTKLTQKFTSHCEPLTSKLEQLKLHLHEQRDMHRDISDEIQSLRTKRSNFLQEIPKLDSQKDSLSSKLHDREQALGRSFYTKSILELTSKVHKQRQITSEVLNDIRKIQKEINSLSGKVDRSFTLIEEVSYKASWSNNKSSQLYRSVISIHEGCNSVVQIIRDTGEVPAFFPFLYCYTA